MPAARPAATGAVLRVMRPRDPAEPHRASTSLELLTDLCFVVAVSQAAGALHHAVAAGHLGVGVLGYVFAFFAIWWTWLNFTWFASAYDNDDIVYRLLTILQILGSLVLAVGVPDLYEHNTVAVLGYVIMRVALVAQWLRAAAGDPERRRTCRRYALGITLVQLGWVASVWVPPENRLPVFLVLLLAEFAVPVIAERAGETSWHPHHVAERYEAFYIIVLGEVILSTADGIAEALHAGDAERWHIASVIIGGVLIVFSVWWLYFSRRAGGWLSRARGTGGFRQYVWGFGHYLIFAAAAGIGAGLAARIDYWTGQATGAEPGEHGTALASAAVLTVSTAVLLAAIWLLQIKRQDGSARTLVPFGVAVLAVLAATFGPAPEIVTGVVCAVLLAVEIVVAGLGPGDPAE